jgi:acetyl-CoA carboxylase carboxyl transferase subunit beta
MSWIHRVRNAISSIAKRETPDNLWHKCKACQQMVFCKEWEENLYVCPKCEHHDRIGADKRIPMLFDPGSADILPSPRAPEDPLKFKDTKKYVDRIKAARNATGEHDALINVRGTICKQRAVVGIQDFAFMGGSMGVGVGEAFVSGVEAAIADACPYIIFTAAGGARMQEGILSLMQMPKATVAIARLRRAGLPYIVVLTDPTTGGVTASYAMLGDVQLAEPGALIGFAGQRVIENTIREKLPDGFQRAEYLLDHGMLDMVTPRKDLRQRLGLLIDYLTPQREAA